MYTSSAQCTLECPTINASAAETVPMNCSSLPKGRNWFFLGSTRVYLIRKQEKTHTATQKKLPDSSSQMFTDMPFIFRNILNTVLRNLIPICHIYMVTLSPLFDFDDVRGNRFYRQSSHNSVQRCPQGTMWSKDYKTGAVGYFE